MKPCQLYKNPIGLSLGHLFLMPCHHAPGHPPILDAITPSSTNSGINYTLNGHGGRRPSDLHEFWFRVVFSKLVRF